MNFAERAFRYLFRKKGKAIILFWVLLITETMILSTVTILRASEVARIELLGKSKAKLLIEREKAEELFTDDEYKKLEKLENVKAVNRVAEVQLYPMDFKIITKSESVDADNQKLRIMAYDSLEDDGPFADGQIHLTKGKYPRKEGEIVVNQFLAEVNQWEIGETVCFKGKKVLDDISYGFEIGKMYAILGPSGSGKTTFLSLLAGLDSPTDGGIYYEGVNIRKKGLHNYRKKNMSLVFQNYNLIDYLTPEENVMLGGKKDIEKILEAVGIPREDWKRQVLQLSGGQQQRVAIARALASPAKVLLADEPTGNLDEEIADEIIKILMKSAHEMGKSVIVVTHSKKIADAADVVLKIHEGKLYHLV